MVRPPFIIRKYYRSLIWSLPSAEKKIYLTFDDGPVPEATPWALDQLKQFNAKATFFCVGDNIRRHSDLFERIKSEGHAIGNHTFNHLNGWKTSSAAYIDNVVKCQELTGTNLFRPPYGRITKTQIKKLKSQFNIIMWDVLSYDFDTNISPEKCLKNVIINSRSGSIIVFHDSLKAKGNLFYALPETLKYFSERKYIFEGLFL